MPSSTHKTGADAVGDVLAAAVKADPAIVLLHEELTIAPAGQVRVLPVSDRATLGVAFGLACAGRRPVVSLVGTSRLPALHEVLSEAGAAAARGDAVPLVVRVPYGTEATGLDRPVGASLAAIAGVHVACGASAPAMTDLLRWALGRAAPTLLLEPRALLASSVASGGGSEAEPHRARVRREGRDVTLVAWGSTVATAIAAADVLSAEGIEADVIDLVSLSPLDREILGARVRATGRLVVAHPGDPFLTARIRDTAIEEAFLYLEAPIAHAAVAATQAASTASVADTARDAVRY
jgi:pyruvate dehydrogenase E1 component beta subunit